MGFPTTEHGNEKRKETAEALARRCRRPKQGLQQLGKMWQEFRRIDTIGGNAFAGSTISRGPNNDLSLRVLDALCLTSRLFDQSTQVSFMAADPALRIKFDQMPQLLKLRKGEFQIDSINSVEDTKGNNGERGILIVTNLRLIWTSAKYARTNLSIGFNCVSSVNIRSVTSKLRGNSQALYVMTRFNSTRFEFIFTSLVKHSPRLFTTVQAVFKSYETTKLYRDLKLRGAIIRDKELIMLPNEQVYERINGIWNLSSDQGNLGTFIITNVRTVWFAVLAENFNVSIPYLQMKSINVRNSKFGQALVIETTASSGGYILGFRADPVEHLEEVYTQIHNLWKIFSVTPIFGVDYTLEDKPQDPNQSFVPRQEDDVQIMEGDEIEPCLLYQPDGEKELDREPIFNNEWLGCYFLGWVASSFISSGKSVVGLVFEAAFVTGDALYSAENGVWNVHSSGGPVRTAHGKTASLLTGYSSDSSDGDGSAECVVAVAPHVAPALEAFRRLDPEAEVHGSHALGLWDERSDLDLLTTKPLVQLLQVLRSSKGCPLELVEYVASARVPRLRLRCGQVELDVVEGGRDPEALAKDQFIRRWLEDESVKGLAMKIKDFTRRNEKELPREEGFPNFFLFLLTGLYFVQRKKEALSSESSTKRSAEELFRGWLTWLADATPKEVDLRDGTAALAAIERAESALRIVEPVSGRTVCSLSAPNAQHLAALATLLRDTLGVRSGAGSDHGEHPNSLEETSRSRRKGWTMELLGRSDGNELSRRELERQLQELRRDKVKIDDNIRRMEATQKRIFGSEEERSKLMALHSQDKDEAKDEKEEDGEKDEKKDEKEEKEKDKEDGEEKEQGEGESRKRKRDEELEKRKKEGRPTKTDPRSRNLFGKLLGHLHSAKDRLQKEKTSKMGQLQSKALSRVEEKVNLSRMNIKEFRKGEFDKQLQEEHAKVSEIEKQIEQKEVLLLQRRLENHYSLMMNFIRTEVQPPIFFLPAKHTRDTEKQLEATRKGIKSKISALKMQLKYVEAAAAAETNGDTKGEAEGTEGPKDDEPEPQASKEADAGEGGGTPPRSPRSSAVLRTAAAPQPCGSNGNDLSRRELERQIQELRRDKVKLDDNIRRMEATQKRIFGEEERAKLMALHSQEKKEEDKEDGEKDGKEEKEEKKEEQSEESKKRKRDEDLEKRKKEGRPTKTDPRSRNLFGKLLGHLHSAKDRLQKEKTSKMGQLQSKALSRVEEKVNLSRMNIKEFRKGEFEKQLVEEQAKVAEIEKQLEEKEVLLLQRRLENHYSLMMNFIRTEVQPPIFFLPAKHTRDTEKMLDATRAGIKKKIATLRMQFKQEQAAAAEVREHMCGVFRFAEGPGLGRLWSRQLPSAR
ncbi:Bardet-Biedl syndrome 5 protein homolog [Durusdinium trenchii]|uniref:Bardet-Biedl syndrome 5 protein homolog n=1 Tax=Durusdinium trenchii TaxID=1381693 RepID=A0ABP0MGI0_9DINO